MDWPTLLQQGYADLSTMRKLGVRLVAGTDTGVPLVYPGFSLHANWPYSSRRAV